MKIINLTQHTSTNEQKAAGVFDLDGEKLVKLKKELTFEQLPRDEQEILNRAAAIAELAADHEPRPDAAMIGGALWLMAPSLASCVPGAFSPYSPSRSVRPRSRFKQMGRLKRWRFSVTLDLCRR